MGMTPSERAEYEASREQRRKEAQCSKCEKNLNYLMTYSPPPPPSHASKHPAS